MIPTMLISQSLQTGLLIGAVALLLVAMFVPQFISSKKQNKAFSQMLDNLSVGDTICTGSGIIGKVTRINKKEEGTTFIIETGDKNAKSTMEFAIGALAYVMNSVNPPKPVEDKKAKKEETKIEAVEAKEEAKPETEDLFKPAAKTTKTTAKKPQAKKK